MASAATPSQPSLPDSMPEALSQPVAASAQAQMRNAQRQYQRAQIETASPTRLIVLLYDGAIRFCSLAIEAVQRRDLEAQNTNLVKAQRIIGELLSSLDRKSGGEVADNLSRLYLHMLEQLVNANLYDQIAPIETVQKMLCELRETWQEIDRMATQGQANSEETPAASTAETPARPKSGATEAGAPPARRPLPKQLMAQSQPASPVSRLGDRSA